MVIFRIRRITNIHDETHARCIVLDDGRTKLVIVVADLCMLTRETVDQAKSRASEITGIPTRNMLISATHTHSGGTSCSVFQSDPDPDYLQFISDRIADAIVRANANLEPARIGWGFGSEAQPGFLPTVEDETRHTTTEPFWWYGSGENESGSK